MPRPKLKPDEHVPTLNPEHFLIKERVIFSQADGSPVDRSVYILGTVYIWSPIPITDLDEIFDVLSIPVLNASRFF